MNDKQLNIIANRLQIASLICNKNNWDIDNLAIEQLLEIRGFEAWPKGDISILDEKYKT